jgi:hypothetical protein
MAASNYLDDYRRSIEAFKRGDLTVSAANLDDNVVVHLVGDWPEQVLVGAASYLRWAQQLFDSVGGDVELKELRQVGDIVAAGLSVRIQGQASGLQEEREYAQLNVYHRGKTALILYFDTYSDALATIGAAQS